MAADQDTLVDLIGRVALNDRRAFKRLYAETSPNIMGLLMGMLKRREAAEDALQDTFVKVWHNARDYHPDRGQVTTWLSSIARYRALDILRREQVHSRKAAEIQAGEADSYPSALSEIAACTDNTRLRECMETLPGDQRQSIGLAFYGGYTHEELALQLETPLGTVKAWVRRGLHKLRECMDA